jgi:hypothetical protein
MSRAVLDKLDPAELEAWAAQGRRLCRGSFKSAKLAARFFRLGPELLDSLSLPALERLADAVLRVSQRSDEMASLLLEDAPPRLARLAREDREPLLALVQVLCGTSWVDAHRCLESGPELLGAVQAEQRTGLLELAAAAAVAGREGFSRFAAAAEALTTLDPQPQAEAVEFARKLAPRSARAAIESLASAPEVLRRLQPEQARRWCEFGLALLGGGRAPERAESYFRLESALAEEMLAELAGRVELARVGATLRLYAKALSGEPVLVQPTRVLVGRNIGWAESAATTTDGLSIFLPPQVDLFGEQRANFQVYKVYTTHQVGRLEFGTFHYRFGADGEHLASTVCERERRTREAEDTPPPALTPMQRFFDLFEDRGLVSFLFSLAEDARIDACVRSEYPGTRSWLRRLQELEAARRPEVRAMALRQAFVENLVRASLGQAETIRWPVGLAARLERGVATLRVLERNGATVQDAAEAAALLYDLAIAIPNLPPHRIMEDWGGLDEDAVAKLSGLTDAGVPMEERLPEGDEVPFQSPDAPDYRGALKPELVQLLDALGRREAGDEGGTPLTREQLLELLEGSAEIELGDVDDDGPADLDELLGNLEREAAERAPDAEADERAGAGEDPEEEIEWFHYDEWEVQPRRAHRGPGGARVLRRDAPPLPRSRGRDPPAVRADAAGGVPPAQAARGRPRDRPRPGHRVLCRQAGGRRTAGPFLHAAHQDQPRRGGRLPTRHVGLDERTDLPGHRAAGRTGKPERSMVRSGSGGGRQAHHRHRARVDGAGGRGARGDRRRLWHLWLLGLRPRERGVPRDQGSRRAARRRRAPAHRRDRADALHAHGSRHPPRHRQALRLRGQGEDPDPRLRRPATGRGRSEKEYAVHDTRRALLEAKHQRITPFLITVDRTGHDYLGQMCGDMGYEVVADIESLPRRLPKLYRHLAGT